MSYPEPRYHGDQGEISALYRPADAPPEVTQRSGGSASYLATGAFTNGRFGLYRWDMAAVPSGPKPHFHKTISESFFILSGTVRLFNGATWVLTPTEDTDPTRYAELQAVISALGADVVALPAARHDALVALVSHVPHLTAATLMGIAASQAEEHATLLRLAAGGFRDMTRIAAGHPAIWPDICAENRDAILDGLDALMQSLADVRAAVAGGDRDGLLTRLEVARAARINLPARAAVAAELVEVRVPVPDRKGVLAEITTLAGDLDVSIYDLEIAHSVEGDRGVLILAIDAQAADRVSDALTERGYKPSITSIIQ